MTRYIFVLFFALTSLSISDCYAQRIKTIIFADTNDPNIGEGADCNKSNMLRFVMEVITALDMSNKCETAIVKDGDDCNTDNLKSVLKDFSCSGDIVFFAYFGHGSRATDDKSDFPQMCLGSKNSDDFIPVEDVKRVLEAKGARLSIILADCCNSPDATTKAKRHVLSAASATTVSDKMGFVFKKLFYETEGTIMGAGCQKGEYSWYYDEGSFFTDAFIDELENYSISDIKNPTWNEVANNIIANVIKTSKNAVGVGDKGFVQTPIFNFSFGKHEDDIIVDSIKIDDEARLRAMLITVANDELSPNKRFEEVNNALKMFSNDAEIVIVGRDHKTILEKLSVEDYLDRVSTSSRLRNFSILDKKCNASGCYTYLKIHEIYIQK